MKFKAIPIIISALAAASVAQGQTIVPGDVQVGGDAQVSGNAQIDGNLTVKQPDSLVSTGTPPVASTPIGNNLNTGFTSTATTGLIYSYSTNGSGTQVQTVQTSGGVQITNQGNVTLSQTTTQLTNVAYDIETRALLVSNPAGYTVQVGDPIAWGPPGTVIPNGTTLPGTGVNVATVRDSSGQLLSVISDLTYDHDNDVATAPIPVGSPLGLDAFGNPILTPAQIAAAVANGAPASFVTVADPVTDPNSGNLTVGGAATISGVTTTNGITNTGDVSSTGDLAVGGAATISGVATTNGIENTGDISSTGDLAVDGLTTTNGIENTGDISSTGDLNVGGLTTTNGIENTGDISSTGDLTVGGLTTTNGIENTGDISSTGNLTIGGQTTTNGIHNSGQKITGVADGTAAGDAVNRGQLDAEAKIRADEDDSIRKEFHLADTNIIKDYTNRIQAEEEARILGDNQVRDEFRAADEGLRNEFRAADRKLRRDIDKNTRGIAMVAAMHNTTVDVGKTHAVDFNLAQFESSTGFSFGYANRINENVQLHTAIASSDDFEEAVARVGVSIQW